MALLWLLYLQSHLLIDLQCCQKRQLHKTKPHAVESRHLPRETFAQHNMTLENKRLFLMRLKSILVHSRHLGHEMNHSNSAMLQCLILIRTDISKLQVHASQSALGL